MNEDATPSCADPEAVLTFWEEAGFEGWYKKDDNFDADIRSTFGALHETARDGLLDHWSETPRGALALIIVLDQFSRNLFRNNSRAFENDSKAVAVARRAIAKGFDEEIEMPLKQFFYLPFEHSEKPEDQAECIRLFKQTGDKEALKWAKIHADIIAQFGRFPHRNEILGRESTAAEEAFLKDGGFAG